LQGVIAQLKESLNNHQIWYGTLIRTLVCKLPGDKHDDIGEKEPIHVEASLGLALLDPDIPVEKSIDRADKALYAAKAAGRIHVLMWDSSM
jgi:GGDEF domain-containing protein